MTLTEISGVTPSLMEGRRLSVWSCVGSLDFTFLRTTQREAERRGSDVGATTHGALLEGVVLTGRLKTPTYER